jgi:hypothetical protein
VRGAISDGRPYRDSNRLVCRISTHKRYDSIGNAPAGVVGVGSTLIPGHFRLGRLDEAAGVCGGRGPSMGFAFGS